METAQCHTLDARGIWGCLEETEHIGAFLDYQLSPLLFSFHMINRPRHYCKKS